MLVIVITVVTLTVHTVCTEFDVGFDARFYCVSNKNVVCGYFAFIFMLQLMLVCCVLITLSLSTSLSLCIVLQARRHGRFDGFDRSQ